MPYFQYPAPALLQAWVVGAWAIERRFEPPQLAQRILPDGCVELIFNLGDPYRIRLASGEEIPAPACYVVGLLRQPLHLLAPAGAVVRTVAARCHPWATAPLLGLPPATPPAPLTPWPAPARLWAVLHAHAGAGQYGAAATELLSYLARQLPPPPPVAAELHAWCRQAATAPPAARPLPGAARRRLERSCRRLAGTSPQQFRRLVRFEQASHYLHAHPTASLAAVAYEFGYADQAHLTHEFRRLSGMSPGRWRAGVPPAAG